MVRHTGRTAMDGSPGRLHESLGARWQSDGDRGSGEHLTRLGSSAESWGARMLKLSDRLKSIESYSSILLVVYTQIDTLYSEEIS